MVSFRKVLELPDASWHELAEQWFCGGCCGGGDKALTLVQNMQAQLTLTHGKALLGPLSMVIHPWELVGEQAGCPTELEDGDGVDCCRDVEEGGIEEVTCEGQSENDPDHKDQWGQEEEEKEEGAGGLVSRCCHSHGEERGGGGRQNGTMTFLEPPAMLPGRGPWEGVRCACGESIGVRGGGGGDGCEVHLFHHKVVVGPLGGAAGCVGTKGWGGSGGVEYNHSQRNKNNMIALRIHRTAGSRRGWWDKFWRSNHNDYLTN